MNVLNVFEDQRFLVRRPPDEAHPLGERIRLSWREIMTGEDRPLQFDYPLEYLNVAALLLCIALTQAVLEPEGLDDLAAHLAGPISDDALEQLITPLRELFTIDGDIRFLQGPEPSRDKKGRLDTGHLSEVMLTMKKGDKVFLNRPAPDSVVALDQIPLMLFARSTFFEKSAGRGYLTGTSGDLEIRTLLIDRSLNGGGSLRRTIWLNVLSREMQENHFTRQEEEEGYDRWMWHEPPPDDIPQSALSLRAGLFWMVANAYIEIAEIESPRPCIVTGDMMAGRVGTGVVVSATGKGYGVKVQREKGPDVRQSFFRHPNAPWETIAVKEMSFTRHFSVAENSGLIGHMGGLFFASGNGAGQKVAPALEQLYALQYRDYIRQHDRFDLLCFGFHMLSSKQNVHGGYEVEQYHYPLLGASDSDPEAALDIAHNLMVKAASRVSDIEKELKRAVQLCTLKEIDAEKKEDGSLQFTEKKRVDEGGIMRDAATALWRGTAEELRELLPKIDDVRASAEALRDATDRLTEWWTDQIANRATQLFEEIFNDYSGSPQHLLAAHEAKRRFRNGLRRIDPGIFERRNRQTQ